MLDDLLQRKPYNAVTDLVDAPVARGLGEKIAFIGCGPFAHLRRAAGAHLPVCGGPEGSRAAAGGTAALLLYDTVDFPVAFWGGVRAGIVVLPLNTLLTAEQYAYILGDSRASAIVASAPLAKTRRRRVLGRQSCSSPTGSATP
jgi:4-hydroxybenzoate-CoA ligase